jgi:hypothetical protein
MCIKHFCGRISKKSWFHEEEWSNKVYSFAFDSANKKIYFWNPGNFKIYVVNSSNKIGPRLNSTYFGPFSYYDPANKCVYFLDDTSNTALNVITVVSS